MQVGIVSAVERDGQQLLLFGAGEGRVEVIEIEGFEIFAAAQNGMLQLAPDVAGQQTGGGDAGADRRRAANAGTAR